MLSALCYALYKPCRGWHPRQPAPVCLLNPAITPQMAVGANSVRPPLFAYMVCTNSPPPQLLETGRRISAKQKLRCSPTGIRASFCRRKIALLGAGFYFILEYNFGQLCQFLTPHSSLLTSPPPHLIVSFT